jgi:hypothetical protein
MSRRWGMLLTGAAVAVADRPEPVWEAVDTLTQPAAAHGRRGFGPRPNRGEFAAPAHARRLTIEVVVNL